MCNLFAFLLGVCSQMVCASLLPEHGKSFLDFTNQGCATVSGRGGLVFPSRVVIQALASGLDTVRFLL